MPLTTVVPMPFPVIFPLEMVATFSLAEVHLTEALLGVTVAATVVLLPTAIVATRGLSRIVGLAAGVSLITTAPGPESGTALEAELRVTVNDALSSVSGVRSVPSAATRPTVMVAVVPLVTLDLAGSIVMVPVSWFSVHFTTLFGLMLQLINALEERDWLFAVIVTERGVPIVKV